MAKTQSLDSDDLIVTPPNNRSATEQRRAKTPTAELVPMQFRMPPDFAQAFKMEAVKRRMKMNELLQACFAEFMKAAK